MIKKIIQKIVHILNISLIVLSLALAIISIFKKEWILSFIEWMKVVIEGMGLWNYLIAGLSSFIEAFPVLGVVVPGQNILLIVGGFFGELSSDNLKYVILVAIIGAILGNFVGYMLGRISGDTFFRKYGMWFGIGLTEVKYLKKGIHKWGALGIIFGKFHPMTRAFLPFIAGSMGMNSMRFMTYNVIGSIIRAFTIVILGVQFAEHYEIIVEYMGSIMLAIFAIVGIYIYKYKRKEFKIYMQEKNQEMEDLYGQKNNK